MFISLLKQKIKFVKKNLKKDYSVAMKYDFTTFHDYVIFGSVVSP